MTKNLSTTKGKIFVRMAAPEDIAALFKLRLEALTAHPEAFSADIEMTRARGEEAWRDQFIKDAREESGATFIAQAGGELIGMAGVGRGHWPKTRHSGIVWGVYVNQQWRGWHIAGALLEECMDWARAHGIVVLKLGVVTSNQAAILCYQRTGFTIYGTEPKASYINGVYLDEYLMARLI